MKNNNYLMLGMVFLIVVLAIQIVSAEDPYGWEYDDEGEEVESIKINYTEMGFVMYGNIWVEKSVLDAFDMDYTEIRVVITVNESINDVDIIKGEIISNLLEDEFELTHNLENSEWFSGNLNKEGLEKLKITNEIIKISKSKGGGPAGEEPSVEESTNNIVEREGLEKEASLNWISWLIGIIIFLILIVVILKIKRK